MEGNGSLKSPIEPRKEFLVSYNRLHFLAFCVVWDLFSPLSCRPTVNVRVMIVRILWSLVTCFLPASITSTTNALTTQILYFKPKDPVRRCEKHFLAFLNEIADLAVSILMLITTWIKQHRQSNKIMLRAKADEYYVLLVNLLTVFYVYIKVSTNLAFLTYPSPTLEWKQKFWNFEMQEVSKISSQQKCHKIYKIS